MLLKLRQVWYLLGLRNEFGRGAHAELHHQLRGKLHTGLQTNQRVLLSARAPTQKWKMPAREWSAAKSQFAVMFEDRFKVNHQRVGLEHKNLMTFSLRADQQQRNSLMPEQLDDSLPSFISENIQAIINAEQATNLRRSLGEAIYEIVGSSIGTLTFVALQLIGVILWVVINAARIPSVRPFDPFPFPILNQIIALEAVLITAFVLMKQNRMSKLADRRAHLSLQINLLTERKSTKIIGMLLEMSKQFDIQHDVFGEESRQLSQLLAIESLIETLQSKFPDR